MKKYPKELQDLLEELHIEKIVALDDVELDFTCDFNVKTNMLIAYYDRNYTYQNLINTIKDQKDDIIGFYEDCLGKTKLPLQTTFKINKVLDLPVKYKVDDDCQGFSIEIDDEYDCFVVSYKSIYSTEVDDFVEEQYDTLMQRISWIIVARKQLEEYDGKVMPETSEVPNNIEGIPIIYHFSDEVDRLDFKFNNDNGNFDACISKSHSNKVIDFLRASNFNLFSEMTKEAQNVKKFVKNLIIDNFLYIPLDKYVKDGKVPIWGTIYTIEKDVSTKYESIQDESTTSAGYGIDTDKKKLILNLNPRDDNEDKILEFIYHVYCSMLIRFGKEFSMYVEKHENLKIPKFYIDAMEDHKLKVNRRNKELALHLFLPGKPRICTMLLLVYGALCLKYKEGTIEFYRKLTEIMPEWVEGAAILADRTEDFIRNGLGLRQLDSVEQKMIDLDMKNLGLKSKSDLKNDHSNEDLPF